MGARSSTCNLHVGLLGEGGGLTLECKVKFVAPPGGTDRLVVRARVVNPGRTFAFVTVDAWVVSGGPDCLCAALVRVLLLPERP